MKELTWQAVLHSQQQDFIKRLKRSLDTEDFDNVTLSCFDFHPFYCPKFYPSERITLSLMGEPNMEDFCIKIVEKYNPEYEHDAYMNHKIGKIGEEAVKIYLDDLITDVDYKIHHSGDGGSDFLLKNNKNIRIQVKTKSLNRITLREIYKRNLGENDLNYINMDLSETASDRVDDVKWSISTKESEQNKVLICVLLMNFIEVDNIGNPYNCIMAGFKPTEEIKYSYDLKIQDLLYIGGIRPFLEFLS